jgi:hypothetical protein
MRKVSAMPRESPFGFAVNPTARAMAQMTGGYRPTRGWSRHQQSRTPKGAVRNVPGRLEKGQKIEHFRDNYSLPTWVWAPAKLEP